MPTDLQSEATKAWVRQHDQSDCGVACLLAVIRFFGGDGDLETLRRSSGTSKTGTTLLGLYQAAPKAGLLAEAYQADIENLKEQTDPCILHIVKQEVLQHYVVNYGFKDGYFIISDPSEGVTLVAPEELDKLWKSKALLLVKNGPEFINRSQKRVHMFRWLWEVAEKDMLILTVAIMLGLVVAILGLSTAIFTQRLIDVFLPEKELVTVFVGLGLLLFLLTVRSVLSRIRMLFLLRQSRDFNNRLIHRFYGALMRLPFDFFSGRKTGDLIARMNDTQRLQSTITFLLGQVIIDVLLFVVSFVFVFYHTPRIALILLTAIPVYTLIMMRFHRPILTAHQQVMQSHAINESNYVDTIQGIEAIKGSGKESVFTDLTLQIYQLFQETQFQLGKVGIRFSFLNEIVTILYITVMFGLGAWLVYSDLLLLGAFMAVVQMGSQMLPAISRLSMTNIQIQEARVAFDRMHAFTSMEQEELSATPVQIKQNKPMQTDGYAGMNKNDATSEQNRFLKLELHNISFRFPGRAPLLREITMEARVGQMVGVLGESGSGKTTLLHLINRLYNLESGLIRVVLDDKKSTIKHADTIPLSAWRSQVAIVPQHVKIFNTGLIQNILLDYAPEQSAVENLILYCQKVGFHDFIVKFPHGYATLLGEEGINLSGGQRQLVGIIRALYRKPSVLLLDESTSAMDRDTEERIMKIVKQHQKEMAVLWVTHRLYTLHHCETTYILKNGVIEDSGLTTELRIRDNTYSRNHKLLTQMLGS